MKVIHKKILVLAMMTPAIYQGFSKIGTIPWTLLLWSFITTIDLFLDSEIYSAKRSLEVIESFYENLKKQKEKQNET